MDSLFSITPSRTCARVRSLHCSDNPPCENTESVGVRGVVSMTRIRVEANNIAYIGGHCDRLKGRFTLSIPSATFTPHCVLTPCNNRKSSGVRFPDRSRNPSPSVGSAITWVHPRGVSSPSSATAGSDGDAAPSAGTAGSKGVAAPSAGTAGSEDVAAPSSGTAGSEGNAASSSGTAGSDGSNGVSTIGGLLFSFARHSFSATIGTRTLFEATPDMSASAVAPPADIVPRPARFSASSLTSTLSGVTSPPRSSLLAPGA